MLVIERARPRRFLSLLGRLGQAPSENPLERLFGAVENAYNRAEEAITLARAGNLEEAKKKAGGTDPKAYVPDSAQAWSMAAWDELAAMKEAEQITEEDRGNIARGVMNPLESAIVGMQRVIGESEQTILRWWNAFIGYGAEIISGTVGFFGEKWNRIVDFYRTTAETNNALRKAIEEVRAQKPSAAVEKDVSRLVIALGKGESILKKIDLAFAQYGLPTGQLKKEAGLGAIQIGATIVAAVGATGTVATVIKVVWGLIAFIGTYILFDYLWEALAGLVGIETQADRERALLEQLAGKEEEKRQAENQAAAAKRAVLELRKAIDQYEKSGLVSQAQILKIRQAAPPEKENTGPLLLFAAGGAFLLLGLIVLKKKNP